MSEGRNPDVKAYPLIFALLLAGCGPSATSDDDEPSGPRFIMTGKLQSASLDEASGMVAGDDGVFFAHNDDGKARLYVIDAEGRDLGKLPIRGAKNRDWEDITRVMGENGPLLVIADTGDNMQSRKKPRLYFVEEPLPGDYSGELEVTHKLVIRYPDKPHDVEAVAYDPSSDMILFLTKRDKPPRLYGIPLDLALWESEAEAQFLAEVPGFRPPTRGEIARNPTRGMWISQPTGMDISADGKTAAVLTYRSLYLFHREEGETWGEAFQRTPVEHAGPPGYRDEAVALGHESDTVYVTTERRPAPIYRLDYAVPAAPELQE